MQQTYSYNELFALLVHQRRYTITKDVKRSEIQEEMKETRSALFVDSSVGGEPKQTG
jgi:two-component SAPR family response regulator